MVTLDERHTTRGRARILYEMLRGDVIRDGFRSQEVHDALDLCLGCKGCKSECPVGVDMAAYKAEFLYRYYQGRRRPNHAYAVGLIHRWSRLASLAPGLANLLGRTAAVKRLAGIDPRRTLPAFAPRTFRSWFARHKGKQDGPPVLLWPDTFTNHFQPEIGIAAVRVLESAGFRVTLPRSGLCCGRPLYDVGMLDLARRQSQEILDALPKGVPMVGLEPSCVAVFRDEMGGTVRMLTLAELLEKTPPLQSPVLVQPHCHHHAVMGLEADRRLLGPNARFLEGCCGMAGGFGFSHYEVSMACAERVLLPALREAPESILLADGFSCREQIRQATGRRALHLAELLNYSARP